MKDQYVSVEHLLLGLVKVKSKAQQLLDALGVSEKDILQALQKVRGGQTVTDQNPDEKYQALERTAATSSTWPEGARSTRSSAAMRRSAGWSRFSAGEPRTTRS